MTEAAKASVRDQLAAEAARWTCPHGRHAGQGCVACYHASGEADPALPLWQIAVWFTSPRPMPIKTLKDVRRHGRRFALDQPSTPWSTSSPARHAPPRARRRLRDWSGSSWRTGTSPTRSP
ncbi:hypothetical protein [Thermocatellispora tengchongensis]|uniref:hypothetical protein n=1 Tax=Thermocatellispora tengchongensis TaxID=1073253 RepID=UPI0036416A04